MKIIDEINRRRTFAIISHPDAGKTTLTEKLLLYGGAVQLAGSVTSRKNQRATTSDWMELERKRGISVSSTVLQFDYAGHRINLLDTPGHKDFSEDTYRVLTAVDAAVMVIDAGKGIEAETRKLFEVCRQRGVPIFTFMNKLDRPTRDPLELMDELESVLGIHAYAMNWPLGTGPDFKGIYDRQASEAHLFERTQHGSYRAPEEVGDIDHPLIRDRLEGDVREQVREELAMLDEAGAAFDVEAVRDGKLTPVFFGSAMNNFGVQLLLDSFLEYAPAPGRRMAECGPIEPTHPTFSGFIFKIQANMDPRHRDRIAFVRVVSGKFTREMTVTHAQTGRRARLSNAQALFGRERETIEEAFPGDVVGVVGGRDFGIGATLTEDPAIVYHEIPRFPPECFAYLHNPNPSQYKRFDQGVQQLLQEGVVQCFELPQRRQKVALLAAVGPLQFEIVKYRLESEYGAEARLESAPWSMVRWFAQSMDAESLAKLYLPGGVEHAVDTRGEPALLFADDWQVRYFNERNADVTLS
ncbi:peptide chain release factor 3 [Phycisphaerales bacterium AB-hyl4]|uniref:Peptide chain release factor 3 n=1 Tax=Natronomicrosphaera hydrolytica TaxID=3242702 RepID=A0ABV4UAU2_9BACT